MLEDVDGQGRDYGIMLGKSGRDLEQHQRDGKKKKRRREKGIPPQISYQSERKGPEKRKQ